VFSAAIGRAHVFFFEVAQSCATRERRRGRQKGVTTVKNVRPAPHWAAVKSDKDWKDLVIFMHARFNEAFDASVHADDIDTAKVRFVCMTASFYEAFAASARADGIDEAKISQMCVDLILYTRDGQAAPPELNAFTHTAASFYEAFAASARAIGMDELNTCSMWFDFILHIQRILNRRDTASSF
jgi:hypothetical protein